MEENLNLVAGANIELIRTGDEVSVNNTYQYDDTALEEEIQQIEASLETYSLITETGSKVQIEFNNTNYKMKVKLLDKNDNVINTSNEIDLPIEQLVKSITYDSETKEIVFTLQDGTQTRVPLSDLISGLVTEEQLDNEVEKLQAEIDSYKTIFNALPKVEGEGENITLDNTANSVMKMNPKGQCKQETTTGKNLFSGGDNISVTRNTTIALDKPIPAGTYTISSLVTSDDTDVSTNLIQFRNDSQGTTTQGGQISRNTRSSIIITTTFETKYVAFYASSNYATSEGDTATFKNTQIEAGSSMTDYEPYTNGASPNPDYPQQIHEVSGDNTIKIEGKNLIWGVKRAYNLVYLNGATAYADYKFKAGTYTLSYKNNSGSSIGCFFQSASEERNLGMATSITFTSNEDFNVWFYRSGMQDGDVSEVQLEVGSTKTDFEPYNGDTYELSLGDIKMRGIGTYEDYFVRNSGKNMFDIQDLVKGRLDSGVIGYESATTSLTLNDTSFSFTTNANWGGVSTESYIEVKPSTDYVLDIGTSDGLGLTAACYDSSKTWLSDTSVTNLGGTLRKFTTPTNTKYIRIGFLLSTAGTCTCINTMLNEGSTALPYEPYGNGEWYLEKSVDKVVLDGSESWNSTSFSNLYWLSFSNYVGYYGISNYFVYNTSYIPDNSTADSELNNNEIALRNGSTKDRLYLKSVDFNDASALQTWLSTHNTIIYYVLSTPTYTKITDSTLIDQLNAVYRTNSYKGQTNISQVNNDLPFKITASALRDLSSLGGE